MHWTTSTYNVCLFPPPSTPTSLLEGFPQGTVSSEHPEHFNLKVNTQMTFPSWMEIKCQWVNRSFQRRHWAKQPLGTHLHPLLFSWKRYSSVPGKFCIFYLSTELQKGLLHVSPDMPATTTLPLLQHVLCLCLVPLPLKQSQGSFRKCDMALM